MRDLRFDTQRLKCRPLRASDIHVFSAVVSSDYWIRRFFEIEDFHEFFDSLDTYECFPVFAFSRATSGLVAYVNGFVRCPTEMLVEYFVTSNYRNLGYARELVVAFMEACAMYGFKTFRFDVEVENHQSIALLVNLGAVHCTSEDYQEDTPSGTRTFFVYKIDR